MFGKIWLLEMLVAGTLARAFGGRKCAVTGVLKKGLRITDFPNALLLQALAADRCPDLRAETSPCQFPANLGHCPPRKTR